jgi:hypothetical protein
LRELFKDKVGLANRALEDVVKFDNKDSDPCYHIGEFDIFLPLKAVSPLESDTHWLVTVAGVIHGDRDTPPDYDYDEVGYFKSFRLAVEAVYVLMAKDELEGRAENFWCRERPDEGGPF